MIMRSGLFGACGLALVLSACSGGKNDAAPVPAGADANGSAARTAPSASSSPSSSTPSPSPVQIHVGDRTLSAPTDFQVATAFYNVIGLEPPFNEWARSDPRARNANEFDRAEIATRIQQELTLAAQAAANIGFIEINTNSQFGEYDMTAQAFRLAAIDADRFFTWNYDGRQYKLTMENANEAQLWRIPQDQARAMIERGGGRSVDIKLRFQIVGAIPEPNGGGTLQGRIVGYEVLDQNNRRVGQMSF